MTDRLKRIAAFYLNSGWLPALLFGGLLFLATATTVLFAYNVVFPELYKNAKPFPFLGWVRFSLFHSHVFRGLLFLSGAGFFAALVTHLVNRRWLKALGGFFIVVGLCFVCSLMAAIVAAKFLVAVKEVTTSLESQPAEETPTPGGTP